VVTRRRVAASLRFAGRVIAKSSRDELGLRSSALAFSTLISMVPLLAVMSTFVARTLREDQQRIFDLVTGLLPYKEESVIAAMRSFLEQTESVSGLALLGFSVSALLTFLGVQESLFRIFSVERPPSLVRQIATFSLLLFWGPLLIGSAQAGLLVLGQSNPEAAELLRESLLLRAAALVFTFVGLSMLYWRAAFRHITLRHAAAGALVATIALELLKQIFTIYVYQFTSVQRAVYGTFAIALFFVLSVQISWYILLAGAEIASCLELEPELAATPEAALDPWFAIGALERLGAPGRPTLGASALALGCGSTPDEVVRQLQPLVDAGLLAVMRGNETQYRLALPTRQVRLASVLAAYRRESETSAPAAAAVRTSLLRARLARANEAEVGADTLADWLAQADELAATNPARERVTDDQLDHPLTRG
jgi:YihY family inner membrane protein